MKKIGIVIVLAMALFAVPALAQTIAGNGGVDVLAQGIFEADGSGIQIPADTSANLDGVMVGNDRALAFGTPWGFNDPTPVAHNDLEIKKNQQTDASVLSKLVNQHQDPDKGTTDITQMALINAEQVKVGNREALAFGSGSATNSVKIVTNQMGGP